MSNTDLGLSKNKKVFITLCPQTITTVMPTIDITEAVRNSGCVDMEGYIVPSTVRVEGENCGESFSCVCPDAVWDKIKFAREKVESILDASIVNEKQKQALKAMLFEVIGRFGELPG